MPNVHSSQSDVKESTNPVTLTSAVSGIEKTLLDLCAELIGYPVRPDDDFFELGIDSLAVAELFQAVEERLGLRIPLRIAAEHPNIRAMARWVAANAPDDSSARSLVHMSRRATGRLLFCVHGIGGHVLVFGPLARRLAGIADFYAFEAVGRSNTHNSDTSIHAMASRYVRDMKRVQPEGPYLLAGYSMGGVVALQMAHELVSNGDSVESVVMLDSAVRPPELVGVRARALEFVSRALGVYPPVTASYDSLQEGAEELARRIKDGGGGQGLSPAEIVQFAEIYLANARAWTGHEPAEYGGNIVFAYTNAGSNSPIPEPASPDRALEVMGWAPYLDPRHIWILPLSGDHWTMLNTDVEELADPLVQLITHGHDGTPPQA